MEVRPEAMRRVLGMTGGLIVADAVMMGLAPALGRQVAHEPSTAAAAPVRGTRLLEALEADPQVAAILDREALERSVDPKNWAPRPR